jgi:hypothetical protein
MKVLISFSNKLLLVVLFSWLLVSCAATLQPKSQKQDYRLYTLTEDEKRDLKCKVIFTTALNEQKVPENNIEEYQLDSDSPLYLYIRFFNLYREEYFACVNLYAEDGKLFDQYDCIIKPKGMTHDFFFLGKYFSSIVKSGKIKAEIKLNNIKVDEVNINFTTKAKSTAKI